MSRSLYVGLVHWPILSKAGQNVATTVTHFDIHDIARVSKAYGAKNYFIIHKIPQQLMYVARVLKHWQEGEGSGLNLMRQKALSTVLLEESIQQARKTILAKEGCDPLVVATAARSDLNCPLISFKELRSQHLEKPLFLLFGTGYGLAPEAIEQADLLLEPIKGVSPQDYRHLSVRSAVSICLDRLFGSW